MTRIGVLTGGGDVPGLNPCIKALVDGAARRGSEVIGIRRGWAGLLHFDLEDAFSAQRHLCTLTPASVRTIDRTGGTVLHTSRTNPGRVRPADLPPFLAKHLGADPDALDSAAQSGADTTDSTAHVLDVIKQLRLDWLVAIGGDDTLSYAERLRREGVAIVAIPKTMDNDVPGTDYCIGFGTAVARSVRFLNDLRTAAGSHERIAVVELFGRNSGETSLITAYLAGAHRALIPEVDFAVDHLAELVAADVRDNPSGYALVTVSEGARMLGGEVLEDGDADAFGHRKLGGIGAATAAALAQRTGFGVISQQLGYLMRSGPPEALDLMVPMNYAAVALELIDAAQSGRMASLRNGVYGDVSLAELAAGSRPLDVGGLYDAAAYRPLPRRVTGMPMFLT